ncbi:SpoIIE family protein phosphatase [Nostoc sp. CHAB 5844]|nr:SpoIIE family protein phosphatase [Nostoc sp. CHAB 5844]
MQVQHESTENLISKLALMQQEISELRIAKIALDAQTQMLEKLIEMAETPELEHVLKVTLEQVVDISIQVTGAESSYLVLLNENGVIKDKIFKHLYLDLLEQQSLIHRVLEQVYFSWVANNRVVTAIPDTLEDKSLKVLPDFPQFVRSVLSVPIFKRGQLLGVLTLMHSQPEFFNAASVSMMQMMAKQIALAIEYARFYGQLETYSQALKLDLEQGRQIQQNFLPQPLPGLTGWEFASFFQPARQLGGDFYDTFLLPNGSIGLVIGDVCDKGVGAALFMGLFRSLLRIFSEQTSSNANISPTQAVMLTNNYIAQNHSELCMFATIFFGVLDPTTGLLTYVNAGHEPPIILRSSGVKERLNPTGPCVGPVYNVNFQEQQVQLKAGDIILGYSDGVPDARSPQGDFFTERRLLSLLEEPALSPMDLIDRIKKQLEFHVSEADPFDDITILAVQQLAPLS